MVLIKTKDALKKLHFLLTIPAVKVMALGCSYNPAISKWWTEFKKRDCGCGVKFGILQLVLQQGMAVLHLGEATED